MHSNRSGHVKENNKIMEKRLIFLIRFLCIAANYQCILLLSGVDTLLVITSPIPTLPLR